MGTIFGIFCWVAGFFYLYRFLKNDFQDSISSNNSQGRQTSTAPAETVKQKLNTAPPAVEPQRKTATKPKSRATASKAKPAAKRATSANPKFVKKSATPKKKSSAKTPTTKTDDLTRINGIGPKIAVFLSSKGIKSYQLLASFDSAKLYGFLQKEGIRVRQDDPQLWAKQATLAGKADWDGLSKLQQKQKSKRQGSVQKAA